MFKLLSETIVPPFAAKVAPKIASIALASTTIVAGSASVSEAQVRSFVPDFRYVVDGAVAEIISATPDGRFVAYTNADDQEIGLLYFPEGKTPRKLGKIDVSDLGEPTSVVMTPNGRYAIAAVLDTDDIAEQDPGHLVFIDMATRARVGAVQLSGIGPDSIAITPNGRQLVVAIEDEEDEDNLPGSRPGSVDIVKINYIIPENSQVTNVPINLAGVPGVNYATDPQPEFVAISPDGNWAAVTIQENNAIALIDIASASVARIFSAGTSIHKWADLMEDDDIHLVEPFEGRREPDTIAFTPDGQYLVTLNEGDTDLERFGDGIWSGGRGWSIFDLNGNVVYDSGSSAEEIAVRHGQYPEGRSENRGIELEGGTVAQFGDRPFAFVASERGSFMLVYDISNVANPRFTNFLPTGLAPEGILALPQRGLVLASNEKDGTIDVFRTGTFLETGYSETEPLLTSNTISTPFGAISSMVASPNNDSVLYAVPDNALSPSRIYTINIREDTASVITAMPLTKNDEGVSYDLEGIALHPDGGFWLVSEGDNREGKERPNLLIHANAAGQVQQEITLPVGDAATITRFGFEGVTTSADGRKVYVAIQREFEGDPEGMVRIGEYDVAAGTWAYYMYPLDTDNVDDSWVGLSEIARDIDGSLLVIERDNQGSKNGASNIRIKRIYRISLAGLNPGDTVEKTLVSDLVDDYNWLSDKVESLAVTTDGYWIINDNDGGEWYNRMVFIPR